jgi:hypothetical protein
MSGVLAIPAKAAVSLLFRAALALALMFPTSMATAAGTLPTVTASRDAWINAGSVNQNNATTTTLRVTNAAAATETRAVIYFTLPTIPANETITSATLKLTVTTSGSRLVSVKRITTAWTETNATWSTLNGSFNSTAEATFTPSASGAVSVNVTSLVRAWYSGTANNGLGLTAALASSGSTAQFASDEATTTANRPQLIITTALISPSLTVLKSSTLVSDPLNGTSNPKTIPGASVRYSFTATNSTAGTPDSNSTVFTDAVPAGMKLFVGDVGAAGSGPVSFTNGTPSSGLSYAFTSLASTTDGLSFSNNGGTSYTYTPVPDASGHDANITHVRVALTGTFAGASGGSNPSLTLQMLMQVK